MVISSTIPSKLPAVRLVFLFIVGILVVEYVPIPLLYIFVSVGIIMFIAVVAWWKSRNLLYSICLHFLFVLVGCAAHRSAIDTIQSQRLQPLQRNELIRIYGLIQSQRRVNDITYQYIVIVDSVDHVGWFGGNPKRVLVYWRVNTNETKNVIRGQRVIILGEIEEFPSPKNPGEFNWGRYLELEHIDGIIRALTIDIKESEINKTIEQCVIKIQDYLYEIYDTLHTMQCSAFLQGLVLGNREQITTEIKEAFIETGTIHILAVSGANVGVVALIFYSLFTLFRLPRCGVAFASIAALLAYMVITGMSPSVVRATIMGIMVLLGTCIERPVNIFNSIAVAALVMLFFDTNALFSTSAQLSFSAVLAIAYFYPILTNRVRTSPEDTLVIRGMKGLYSLFAISLAAQLGTLPFTAYYFGRISLVSFAANLVVVPIAGILLILGFIEIVAAQGSLILASIYAEVTELLYEVLVWVVQHSASVPFAALPVGTLVLSEVVLYFLVVIGLTVPKRMVKYSILGVLLVGNVVVYLSLLSGEQHCMASTFFDVGQGDACLIEFPHNTYLIVDTGPKTHSSDAGKRIILPYLQKNRIDRVQYIVITHPHDDHYGGMVSLLHTVHVDTLVIPFLQHYPEDFHTIIDEVEKRGTIIKKVKMGDQLYPSSDVRCYVLAPSETFQGVKNSNNASIVLKVVVRENSLLFMGDAEFDVERVLVQRYSTFLQSKILKVGHHGSISSTSDEFLEYVQPSIAIISVGKTNRYNHPSDIVLTRLRNRNISVKQTSYDNAIVVMCTEAQIVEKSWKE
ncbi:MAG: DNA internalization-related competence protein ComEC/Rec2 [Bacteroidetes bacterium]|nr:DNA internalization-related competence protein ComEC/Rec2 [Bacteroidota bacterium]